MKPNLSFGGGMHYCIGAKLARMEMVAALSRLAFRASVFAPAASPVRQLKTRLRCYASLPLAIRPA